MASKIWKLLESSLKFNETNVNKILYLVTENSLFTGSESSLGK